MDIQERSFYVLVPLRNASTHVGGVVVTDNTSNNTLRSEQLGRHFADVNLKSFSEWK